MQAWKLRCANCHHTRAYSGWISGARDVWGAAGRAALEKARKPGGWKPGCVPSMPTKVSQSVMWAQAAPGTTPTFRIDARYVQIPDHDSSGAPLDGCASAKKGKQGESIYASPGAETPM